MTSTAGSIAVTIIFAIPGALIFLLPFYVLVKKVILKKRPKVPNWEVRNQVEVINNVVEVGNVEGGNMDPILEEQPVDDDANYYSPGFTSQEIEEKFPPMPLYDAIRELMELRQINENRHREEAGQNEEEAIPNIPKEDVYYVSNSTDNIVLVEGRPSCDLTEQLEIIRMVQDISEGLYRTLCIICQGPIGGNPRDNGSGEEEEKIEEGRENDEREDIMVKQLPCGHIFHDECIPLWLTKRKTCPICNRELF